MNADPDDIDRPLGRDKRPRGKWRRPGAGAIALCLCAIVLFAGSGAIAFRDRPFQQPPDIVTAEAEPQQAAEKPERADGQDRTAGASGPAIIRVERAGLSSQGDGITIRDPATLNRNPKLAHLPDRALIEETEFGPLPAKNPDGLRPFDVYAAPFSGTGGARIAVVVGGLGISQTGTQKAIRQLPEEITLGFAPQGNSLGRWMRDARQEGHEIVLQVPLEPFNYSSGYSNRHTLLVEASAEENLENLHWALGRITNYTGVMNYQGARFTANDEVTGLLMEELGRRGLLFLYDGTSARSLTKEIAAKKGVPFAESNVVIDGEPERGQILEALNSLESIARARGYAVGVGSALDVTVDTVADWAREVRQRGIVLVPVSAVAVDPEEN